MTAPSSSASVWETVAKLLFAVGLLGGLFALLNNLGSLVTLLSKLWSRGPKIRAEILDGWFFCPLSSTPGEVLDAEVLLRIGAVNQGLEAVSVQEWAIQVEIERTRYTYPPEIIMPWLVACRPFVAREGFSSRETWKTEWPLKDLRNTSEPYEHGKAVEGWLRFVLPGAEADRIKQHGRICLIAKDALGKEHAVACRKPGEDWTELKILHADRPNDAYELRSMHGPKPPSIQ